MEPRLREDRQRSRPILITTDRGDIETKLYDAEGDTAVILVGGIGGGFDTPAQELYPRLGRSLPRHRIRVLRIRFRDPTDLVEAAFDVLASIELLVARGVIRIGLVGHSFGGAVVITAALASPLVRTVVTLSTQSYGATGADRLSPRPLLMLHGATDSVIPAASSESIYAMAHHPKEIEILPGTGHTLTEAADRVYTRVSDWLQHELRPRLAVFVPGD